jgi:hypothetical protein
MVMSTRKRTRRSVEPGWVDRGGSAKCRSGIAQLDRDGHCV